MTSALSQFPFCSNLMSIEDIAKCEENVKFQLMVNEKGKSQIHFYFSPIN